MTEPSAEPPTTLDPSIAVADAGDAALSTTGDATSEPADSPQKSAAVADARVPDQQARKLRKDALVASAVYFLFTLLLPIIPLPRRFSAPMDEWSRIVSDVLKAKRHDQFLRDHLLGVPSLPHSHQAVAILTHRIGQESTILFDLAVAGLLSVIGTALFMLLQLYLARAIVRTRRPVGVAAALTALFTVMWILAFVAYLPHPFLGVHLAYAVHRSRFALLGFFETVALSYLGTVISRIIREPNVLLPVAFVAMPIDYLGAMAPRGFTHDALATHPEIVKAVSVSVPSMGYFHPIGFVGPGDVLFMAFFLTVVQNLRMNEKGTFQLMYVLLTLTMLVVTISPVQLQIAALIPMGLAVLIANRKCFNLKREEVFAMFYAIAIVLALVVAFYLTSHRYLFERK